MSGGWPTASLGDLLEDGALSYGIVQPGRDDPSGVPIVRVKDLSGGRIDGIGTLKVAREISERHSRTRLRGGELLLSVVGSVGETAVVPPALEGWNVARAIAVLRPSGVSAQWLRLVFESAKMRDYFSGVLNTTVQATLNLADIKRAKIPMPPADVRTAITDVIGALDDKITVNVRVVAAADALRLASVTAASVGGTVSPLSALARFVNGRAFTKNATGTGRVVVRIAELNSGVGGSTVYNDIEVVDDHLTRPGDLLFAWSGSLTVARWYREEAIVNQHIFKVVPEAGRPLWLVDYAVRTKLAEFKAVAADKATTMGHIQRHHLDEPVPVPPGENVEVLDVAMTSLWNRALAAERESLQLARTRDELLPLLMSGKVPVKDAEKVVEEVV
ncbi:restriction endonuclease subunit S [Pseudonocardia endophytica]|uniref:Type I restriction enzyme S subunit n=1 Tax=Pseudonocardia endophytica TaxID=401976 RepID=A0A4R1HMZ7_PSEEN|nr:restriction endonuclease subunit S [Pseudonocardia endophytica]TCK21945.1 type I restriction enzyme S subunit [Pseudonocardia endophytica]